MARLLDERDKNIIEKDKENAGDDEEQIKKGEMNTLCKIKTFKSF